MASWVAGGCSLEDLSGLLGECVCVCVCILRPSSTTWPEGHVMGLQVRFAAQDGQRGGCQLDYLNIYINGPPEGGPSRYTALHDVEYSA